VLFTYNKVDAQASELLPVKTRPEMNLLVAFCNFAILHFFVLFVTDIWCDNAERPVKHSGGLGDGLLTRQTKILRHIALVNSIFSEFNFVHSRGIH
jgi:hypothetical protein